ncbi:hypothetical protein JOM56_008604 [Amanita muscaria]
MASKRFAHAPPTNPPSHPSISDDLATRLRNLGSRIRKNVNEGYATRPSESPQFSPTKSADIFQSAKDTLHDVFHSQPSTPPVSPRKRQRSDSDDDGTLSSDSDMEMADELPSLADPSNTPRPIKPLKGAKQAKRVITKSSNVDPDSMQQ